MRDEPESLPRPVLARGLEAHWGIEVRTLEYAPVGAGSYHWTAEDGSGRRWFITADNLRSLGTQDGDDADANFAGLRAAYETASALHQDGLSFVTAPVANSAGKVILRILPDWAVAAFPFIQGENSGPGEWTDSGRRTVAAGLIAQLHGASPPDVIRRWDFAIPHRPALSDALQQIDRPWSSGPYGERARELLAASRLGLEALLNHYDALAEAVALSPEPSVITHGEPHSANFLTAKDGLMYLIDWDTVRLGPRERDLEIVVGGDAQALSAYQADAGPFTPLPQAMELFRARWTLADICVYVRRFRQSHGDSWDDQTSWEELTRCLRVDP